MATVATRRISSRIASSAFSYVSSSTATSSSEVPSTMVMPSMACHCFVILVRDGSDVADVADVMGTGKPRLRISASIFGSAPRKLR
jgi:hypothetical protein